MTVGTRAETLLWAADDAGQPPSAGDTLKPRGRIFKQLVALYTEGFWRGFDGVTLIRNTILALCTEKEPNFPY